MLSAKEVDLGLRRPVYRHLQWVDRADRRDAAS